MIASFLLVGDQSYVGRMVVSVQSVLGCPIVQMSDLKTPKVEGVDEVIRLPFRVPLMLYRLKHLASFPHEEMLILDTDVIAKAPVDDVWHFDFDIALTRRPEVESFGMPFNTGVMFSRTRDFWQDCYRWLETQKPELHAWYGDQHAVAAIAKRGEYDICSLPAEEFNWSPNSWEDSSDARFWHYKGRVRKKWLMKPLASTEDRSFA